MDLRKLKTLIDLVSESGVAELEITEGEDRVRIVNRSGAAPVQLQQPITVAQQMPRCHACTGTDRCPDRYA